MQIAVIGSTGQVGSEIVDVVAKSGLAVLALTHAQCDVTDQEALESAFESLTCGDVVVNTAAYHRVDECESHPQESFTVNACGAFNAAAAAKSRGATTVYFSTDYVFDGAKRSPYLESDRPDPLNVYGTSKLAAELVVRAANPKHYIVRIASVFGTAGSKGKGGNFVETMLAKARAGDQLRVVDDMIMSPTYAADVAALVVGLLTKGAPFGVYHLANSGACSWHEFAAAIFSLSGHAVAVGRTTMARRPTPARRPAYSALASERLGGLGLQTRPWRDALAEYLQAKGHVDATAV